MLFVAVTQSPSSCGLRQRSLARGGSVEAKRINPLNHKSDAVVWNGLVFLSGMVPKTPSANVETQSREVLEKIDHLLQQAGSDRSKLLSASIWLADINDYLVFNSVWNEWIISGKQPARACVQARLAVPGAVEVAVIATV
jgi:enamine deaminase RidA (YjgF/YER057c/UK114 family)